MEIVGLLILTGALIGLGYFVLCWGWTHPASKLGEIINENWPWGTPKWAREKIEQHAAKSEERYRAAVTAKEDPEDHLEDTKTDVVMLSDGAKQVAATATLLALRCFDDSLNRGNPANANWKHEHSGMTLPTYAAKLLKGGEQLLIKLPISEAAELDWFLLNKQTIPGGFMEMIAVPAKAFGKAKQAEQVEFRALDRTWLCRDIVWADIQVEKSRFLGAVGNSSRVSMILAQNRDDDKEWFLFVLQRRGGVNNSLWVGRSFDVPAEIDVV